MDSYEAMNAAAAGASAGSLIVSLVVGIACLIGYWKVFEKAGEAGWKAIVPFLNLYTLFKISMGNGWLFLLMFVPCANLVFAILMLINMNKAFGQSGAMVVLAILLEPVYFLMLGFGSATYIGPKGEY